MQGLMLAVAAIIADSCRETDLMLAAIIADSCRETDFNARVVMNC